MKPLTPKQARFVEEYLIDLNGTRAAIRAGYKPSSASARGAQLLALRKVRAAVDTAIAERSARAEVKQDDVLRELKRIAFSDLSEAFDDKGHLKHPKDMSPEIRRAIASVEVETDYHASGELDEEGNAAFVPTKTVTTKLKTWDKNTALTNLAKHLKLLTEVREDRSKDLTDEQIDARIAALMAKGSATTTESAE